MYASVDEGLSGTNNLIMIGRLLGLTRRDGPRPRGELLARFELTDAAGRAAKTYSGGMRRRLDLAAALLAPPHVGRPRVLYLDEPTTGLDPHSRNEVWGMIRQLVADGTTVLLTTQYLEEADQLAHDIAVIDHGRGHRDPGRPNELKASAGRQFLEVTPASRADLSAVAELLERLIGAAPTIGVESGQVSVPGRRRPGTAGHHPRCSRTGRSSSPKFALRRRASTRCSSPSPGTVPKKKQQQKREKARRPGPLANLTGCSR